MHIRVEGTLKDEDGQEHKEDDLRIHRDVLQIEMSVIKIKGLVKKKEGWLAGHIFIPCQASR